MEHSIIEYLVSQLLSTAIGKWRRLATRVYEDFDFVIEDQDGRTVAIIVLNKDPHERKISQLSEVLAAREKHDECILVTPNPPTANQSKILSKVLSESKTPVKWIGINDLPQLLDIKSPGDLTKPEGAESLKIAALVSSHQLYSESPIGTIVPRTQNPEEVPESIPRELIALSRQFAFRQISGLTPNGELVRESLGIGSRKENVTVVLTDLKNFSSLVKASRADDLNELMGKYYFEARALVWKHNGVLDKFIGDAVLAIFGYPNSEHSGAVDAIKFSQDLVNVGRELLNGLSREINEDIPTGTRVGIATGDLWPLDIGNEHIEVSFVGDTINLAARLEKNAHTDHVLISNRTRTRAISEDGEYFDSLASNEKELTPEDAKGQLFPLKCWEIGNIVSHPS